MHLGKRPLGFALAAALLLPWLAAPAGRASAQTAAAPRPDLGARLAAVEKAVEERRQQLGVPGLSLVIVKDDRVIYMKGLGYKDFERKVPATPDTLFAIGSSSKAFTSMLVAMAADEGSSPSTTRRGSSSPTSNFRTRRPTRR